MKRLLLIYSFFLPISLLQAQWKFESGSVAFSIKNAGLTVNGTFRNMKASIAFDPNQPATAMMEASVESATVETGINLRNKHLKKSEYFNVEKFPLIQMKLKRLEKENKNWKGTFVLTLKGITKEVMLPVTFSESGKVGSLKGNFTIDRRDYAVGGSSWTIGDDVEIIINVILTHLKS